MLKAKGLNARHQKSENLFAVFFALALKKNFAKIKKL